MVEVTCPYCSLDFEVEGEEIDINNMSNMECKKCGKYFGYTADLSIDIYPHVADCLNGIAEHHGKIGGFCGLCGEHIDPKEKDKDYE